MDRYSNHHRAAIYKKTAYMSYTGNEHVYDQSHRARSIKGMLKDVVRGIKPEWECQATEEL